MNTSYKKQPRSQAAEQLQDVLDKAEEFAAQHNIPFIATYEGLNGHLHTFKHVPKSSTQEIALALRELGETA